MKKLLLLLPSLLLAGCASTPYGTGSEQGYFLGPATITSNVPNLCKATNSKYAFMEQQYWLAGGAGLTSFGCTAAHSEDLTPKYMLSYYIINNDGTGRNIVSECTPVYSAKGGDTHFTTMRVVVDLKAGKPTCQMILR